MKENTKIILSVAVTAIFAIFVFYIQAGAFNGPSATPPTGGGAISVNSMNNISIGTSTTVSSTKVYIVASSTADSNNYALLILDSIGNVLLSVRNDGVVIAGSSTFSAGSFNGTMSAGNVSAGQFGSNTGGGNYTFSAGLTQSGGLVSLASTTVAGNVTTTKLTVTGLTNALYVSGSSGVASGYAGGSCSAGNAITGVSASGTLTCSAFSTGGGGGAVSTSSAISTSNFPYWATTTGGLNGTSTLTISGTTITQANNFLIGGALNVTSTLTVAATTTILGKISAGTSTVPASNVQDLFAGVATSTTIVVGATSPYNPGCVGYVVSSTLVVWQSYEASSSIQIHVATSSSATTPKCYYQYSNP